MGFLGASTWFGRHISCRELCNAKYECDRDHVTCQIAVVILIHGIREAQRASVVVNDQHFCMMKDVPSELGEYLLRGWVSQCI